MAELPYELQHKAVRFLMNEDWKLTAGSVCGNFLRAMFDFQLWDEPRYVDIAVADSYFAITAVGSGLNTHRDRGNSIGNFPHAFDVSNYNPREFGKMSPSLQFLAPIVWFTEHCLSDISNGSDLYRQAYCMGRPLGARVHQTVPINNLSKIAFCFTLPPQIFENPVLDISSLKTSIALWRKVRPDSGLAVKLPKLPKLQLRWRKQDSHNYSLRIVPIREEVS